MMAMVEKKRRPGRRMFGQPGRLSDRG